MSDHECSWVITSDCEDSSKSTILSIYHNIPHTTTGIAPAHLALTQAPRTHLSMSSPSVYQYVKLQLQPTPEQTNDKINIIFIKTEQVW